jgi:hypothetical protein
MKKKHPTLGKRTLARMYFLTKDFAPNSIESIESNLPLIIEQSKGKLHYDNIKKGKEKFKKIFNSLWTFRGRYSNKRSFSFGSKGIESNKIVYLLDPSNAAKISPTSRNVIPVALRTVHAYHDDVDKLVKFKLKLSLTSSSNYLSSKKIYS